MTTLVVRRLTQPRICWRWLPPSAGMIAYPRPGSDSVRTYADLIGEQLGLSVADREKLHWSALVHDRGQDRGPGGSAQQAGPTQR